LTQAAISRFQSVFFPAKLDSRSKRFQHNGPDRSDFCLRSSWTVSIWLFNPKPSALADRCSADLFERCRAVIVDLAIAMTATNEGTIGFLLAIRKSQFTCSITVPNKGLSLS
jgi:hypothetical protein